MIDPVLPQLFQILSSANIRYHHVYGTNTITLPGTNDVLQHTLWINVNRDVVVLSSTSRILSTRFLDWRAVRNLILGINCNEEAGKFREREGAAYPLEYIRTIFISMNTGVNFLPLLLVPSISALDSSFKVAANDLTEQYFNRTIPHTMRTMAASDPALSTERTCTIGNLVDVVCEIASAIGTSAERLGHSHVKMKFASGIEAIADLLTDMLILRFSDRRTGVILLESDIALGISSFLTFKSDLLTYERKQQSLEGVFKVYLACCGSQDAAEGYMLLCIKRAKEEFEARLRLCRVLEIDISPAVPISQLCFTLTCKPPQRQFALTLELFPKLSTHPLSACLVFPPTIDHQRGSFSFSLPLTYEPIWSAIKSRPAAIVPAIVQIIGLIQTYAFEELSRSAFLTPQNELKLLPISVTIRQNPIQTELVVAEFLRKLTQMPLLMDSQQGNRPMSLHTDADTASQHRSNRVLERDIMNVAFGRLRLSQSVIHPNIVPIIGVERRSDGQLAMLEENFRNFTQFLAEKPYKEEIFEVILRVGEALEYIHSCTAVHLNIRPETVFVALPQVLVSYPLLFPFSQFPPASVFTPPEVCSPATRTLTDLSDAYSYAQLIKSCWELGFCQQDIGAEATLQKLRKAVWDTAEDRKRTTVGELRRLVKEVAIA